MIEVWISPLVTAVVASAFGEWRVREARRQTASVIARARAVEAPTAGQLVAGAAAEATSGGTQYRITVDALGYVLPHFVPPDGDVARHARRMRKRLLVQTFDKPDGEMWEIFDVIAERTRD